MFDSAEGGVWCRFLCFPVLLLKCARKRLWQEHIKMGSIWIKFSWNEVILVQIGCWMWCHSQNYSFLLLYTVFSSYYRSAEKHIISCWHFNLCHLSTDCLLNYLNIIYMFKLSVQHFIRGVFTSKCTWQRCFFSFKWKCKTCYLLV